MGATPNNIEGMNLIEQWSEIPAARRHWYFYVCLLLTSVSAHNLKEEAATAVCSQVDSLVKVIELKDAPPPTLENPPGQM